MLQIAARAVERARQLGAQQAAAGVYRSREVSIQWRDGQMEKVIEATSRGLGVDLYVDGRFASVSTCDMRDEALDRFLQDAVALTRTIAADPFRQLPDPQSYPQWARRSEPAPIDLELEDPDYAQVTALERRELAEILEQSARKGDSNGAILSVTTSVSDSIDESWRVHSNGFSAARRGTSYWLGADVSVQDVDGRRPEEAAYAGSRFFNQLPQAISVGQLAVERALGRLGSVKPASAVQTLVVDQRASGRLLAYLMGPMSGAALQQKRTFLGEKLGQSIGSPLLHVQDDPFVKRGFGSRLVDSEGIEAKPRVILDQGRLSMFFIDTYYGRKLGVPPTTSGSSNLAWQLGSLDAMGLIAQAGEGLYVTGFLGGNSNATTGDFSLGVQGFAIRNGKLAEPVAEANIADNHLQFWPRLVAVGNDPYPYSSMRTPSLVFDKVMVAGT